MERNLVKRLHEEANNGVEDFREFLDIDKSFPEFILSDNEISKFKRMYDSGNYKMAFKSFYNATGFKRSKEALIKNGWTIIFEEGIGKNSYALIASKDKK